jgi:hypothetical protein
MFTLAPRLPNSNAIPAPIPREAPVTIAVFPWRGRLGLSEDMVSIGSFDFVMKIQTVSSFTLRG